MRNILLILVFVCLAVPVCAEKIATFPDLLKPQGFDIAGGDIFITEGASVYIYSLENFQLKKKFGSVGEGPNEFKPVEHLSGKRILLSIKGNDLIIYSMAKVSYYSRNGEFKKELKALSGQWFIPMDDNFLGNGYLQEDKTAYITVNIYDSNLKKVREVYRHESLVQQGKQIRAVGVRPSLFYFSDDKIFIDNKEKDAVMVFDRNGEKLYSITAPWERLKVTDNDKERYYEYYRCNPVLKPYFSEIKRRLTFPDYFPPIKYFYVSEDRVFVQTYRKDGENCEFYIFEPSGKLLSTEFLPVLDRNARESYPAVLTKDKIYQLIEDEETEKWSLYITSMVSLR